MFNSKKTPERRLRDIEKRVKNGAIKKSAKMGKLFNKSASKTSGTILNFSSLQENNLPLLNRQMKTANPEPMQCHIPIHVNNLTNDCPTYYYYEIMQHNTYLITSFSSPFKKKSVRPMIL